MAFRLGKGCAVGILSEEFYVNDDVSSHSFESVCRNANFEKTRSWTDLDREPLSQAVLGHRLITVHEHRDLVRLHRVSFNPTVSKEHSRWAFSTILGASLRWGLKKLSISFRARAIRFLDDRHQHVLEAAKSAKSVEK